MRGWKNRKCEARLGIIVLTVAMSASACMDSGPLQESMKKEEGGAYSHGTALTASDLAYRRDKVKLVWVGYNMLSGGKKDAILARWHDKYPNIEVVYKDFPAEPPSYSQALNGAFSSNETMDVLLLSHEEVLPRAQNGQLHELDSMALQANDSIDAIFGGKLRSIQLGGYNYQLPYTLNVEMLYYNKDLFDSKGVPYPDEHTTFEELVSMAKRLQEGTGSDKVWGYIGKNPLQPALNAGWSWMKDVLSPSIADARVRKSLELHKELFDSGASPSYLQLRLDKLKASVIFAEGKAAMMVENWWPQVFWSMQKYNSGTLEPDEPGFRYDITFLPRYDETSTPKRQEVLPGWGYSVNARTKHPLEAYMFAKFLSTEIPDLNGHIPADKTADMSLYNQIFNTFIDKNNVTHTGLYPESYLRKLKRVMEETVPIEREAPPDKTSAQLLTDMKEAFNRETDRYFAGRITVDELMERVQAYADKEAANAGAPEETTAITKNDKVW